MSDIGSHGAMFLFGVMVGLLIGMALVRAVYGPGAKLKQRPPHIARATRDPNRRFGP